MNTFKIKFEKTPDLLQWRLNWFSSPFNFDLSLNFKREEVLEPIASIALMLWGNDCVDVGNKFSCGRRSCIHRTSQWSVLTATKLQHVFGYLIQISVDFHTATCHRDTISINISIKFHQYPITSQNSIPKIRHVQWIVPAISMSMRPWPWAVASFWLHSWELGHSESGNWCVSCRIFYGNLRNM